MKYYINYLDGRRRACASARGFLSSSSLRRVYVLVYYNQTMNFKSNWMKCMNLVNVQSARKKEINKRTAHYNTMTTVVRHTTPSVVNFYSTRIDFESTRIDSIRLESTRLDDWLV